ncbi:glycosyltransferase family 4 protein, partial [Patescibacteria group bacterium]|nr:glycosyltransferase family 4 protein [Patescibacteria group bacterium]
KRHYESEFFDNLKNDVDFDVKYLYPMKGKKYSTMRHFLNHLIHPFKFFLEFRKDRIKHVMFTEEAFMLNFLPTQKTVVSCLDVIPMVMPDEASGKFKQFLKLAYRGMKRASIIIANSNYTKNDIVRYLHIDEKKIDVAYPPVNEIFKGMSDIGDAFYKKYNLDRQKKYLLYVGALDLPRKNVGAILKAFDDFRKTFQKGIDESVELLLVGYTTLKGDDSISDQIKKMNLADYVSIISDVPDEDLVCFYNVASVFLFPTLYEGFGLPPIEAMACGTPVIASNVTSVPEVLGDAALFVEPHDFKAISKNIHLLLTDAKLCDEKIAAGKKRASLYNWENYCQATLKTYRKLWQ